MIPFPLVFPQKVLLSILSSPLWLSVKATKHPLSNLGWNVGQFQGYDNFSPFRVHAIILCEIWHSSTQITIHKPARALFLGYHSSKQAFSQPGDPNRLLTEEAGRHQEVGRRRLNLRPHGSQEQRSHCAPDNRREEGLCRT